MTTRSTGTSCTTSRSTTRSTGACPPTPAHSRTHPNGQPPIRGFEPLGPPSRLGSPPATARVVDGLRHAAKCRMRHAGLSRAFTFSSIALAAPADAARRAQGAPPGPPSRFARAARRHGLTGTAPRGGSTQMKKAERWPRAGPCGFLAAQRAAAGSRHPPRAAPRAGAGSARLNLVGHFLFDLHGCGGGSHGARVSSVADKLNRPPTWTAVWNVWPPATDSQRRAAQSPGARERTPAAGHSPTSRVTTCRGTAPNAVRESRPALLCAARSTVRRMASSAQGAASDGRRPQGRTLRHGLRAAAGARREGAGTFSVGISTIRSTGTCVEICRGPAGGQSAGATAEPAVNSAAECIHATASCQSHPRGCQPAYKCIDSPSTISDCVASCHLPE